MKLPVLSNLARTYLEHYDAISAGWSALLADIPRILSAVATRLRQEGQNVVLVGDSLERTWSDMGDPIQVGFAATLRLKWSVSDPLRPVLTLNQDAKGHSEVPRAMREIFDKDLLASWRASLEQVEGTEWLENAAEALYLAWIRAAARVEEIRRSAGTQDRMAAFVLLSEVSSLLHHHKTSLAAMRAEVAQRAGEVGTEPGWPAYVQINWNLGEAYLYWTLTWSAPERLELVLFGGRTLQVPLSKETPRLFLAQHPIVADMGDALRSVLEARGMEARMELVQQEAPVVVERVLGCIRDAEEALRTSGEERLQ